MSIEENGVAVASGTGKIPYVSPPGILRDKEYGSSSTSRLQNEQSLRLAVVNLRDGFAKAAYKNITINMLRYKRLRMYLHGDTDDPTTLSGDVQAFLRIGTDYSQNYYQYSLPLKLTAVGDQTPDGVWPVENRIDVSFQDFIDAKAKRNQQPAIPICQIPFTVKLDNGATITVLGNPDFSAVQGVMLGILNPTGDLGTAEKTVNLWADEFPGVRLRAAGRLRRHRPPQREAGRRGQRDGHRQLHQRGLRRLAGQGAAALHRRRVPRRPEHDRGAGEIPAPAAEACACRCCSRWAAKAARPSTTPSTPTPSWSRACRSSRTPQWRPPTPPPRLNTARRSSTRPPAAASRC